MPVRDYYLNQGAKFDGYRAAYKTYVTRMFELRAIRTPAESAAAMIALETKIAEVHWPRREAARRRRRPTTRSIAPGCQKMAPAIRLGHRCCRRPASAASSTSSSSETTAVRDGGELLDSQPIAAWKDYLAFHFANQHATIPAEGVRRRQFAFFARPCAASSSSASAGSAASRCSTATARRGASARSTSPAFPAGRPRRQMDELVANLRAALGERLEKLAWMDEHDTRRGAEEARHLRSAHRLPDKWRDYSALTIDTATTAGQRALRAGSSSGTASVARSRSRSTAANGG